MRKVLPKIKFPNDFFKDRIRNDSKDHITNIQPEKHHKMKISQSH